MIHFAHSFIEIIFRSIEYFISNKRLLLAMEFEEIEWGRLTAEQQRDALQFVPSVMDQSLGDAFVACVTAEAQKDSEFNLKASGNGVGKGKATGDQ